MGRFITWFDVETEILRKKFANEWPDGMTGISVFPNLIEIRIQNNEDKETASSALRGWFGPKYSDGKIYLDSLPGTELRHLKVDFEINPDEERIIPTDIKPDFANLSLYPEDMNLKGPDFSKMRGNPSIWAFYSFKGGVSRTVHLLSFAKALSEVYPDKPLLIVDADLEAPGLTWWAREQMGEFDISFLDFLTLAHYDTSENYADTLQFSAEQIRQRMLVFKTREFRTEHYFLPAFREIEQAMRMPIRPEHVSWQKGKEWIVSELLWHLGKTLGVDYVLADLRAGLSEISSPLLLDPRIERMIVTTASSQSVEGTKLVLKQNDKIYDIFPDFYKKPTVILSMIKEDKENTHEIEQIKEDLNHFVISETSFSDWPDGGILQSLFDERLLYLKNLDTTLRKLEGTDVQNVMTEMLRYRKSIQDAVEFLQNVSRYEDDLKILAETAKNYTFAESGKADEFLKTHNLKNLARKFEKQIPTAVIMGAKGSGKTYSYLQLARLHEWSSFIEKIEGTKKASENRDFIWPLLTSQNFESPAKDIIKKCREHVINNSAIPLCPLSDSYIREMIVNQINIGQNDLMDWKNFWIRIITKIFSCEKDRNPLAIIQKKLSENNISFTFLVDGLEDCFQYIDSNKDEQTAVRVLCQEIMNSFQEWPDNRIGLLVFARKDIVKSSIRQNFGQFEARYQSFELKWDRQEALQLVAWLVSVASKLEHYVRLDGSLENILGEPIEKALEPLWGLKLGKAESKEAYTANWVIAALSDFNGQLQARDVVRLIRFAAEDAIKQKESPDRLLPPASIKNAIDPCSKEKIAEIQQEISSLKYVFEKISKAENRKIPFERQDTELSDEDIKMMEKYGILTEYKNQYYLPEIFRRGLGFTLEGGARPKVLTLLRRSLKKLG
ncbi:MAG: hypothetical protein V2I97_03335 [Desulfococcaceae bacterium]|jgi:cellulose biosynthesis protein BcsQ|nr:hypothetical protein [Desulfococcaceae bacterium]